VDLREADRVHKGEAYRHPWELSRAASDYFVVKQNPSCNMLCGHRRGCTCLLKMLRYTSTPVYAVDNGYTCIERIERMICLPSFDMVPDGRSTAFSSSVLEHTVDEHAFLEGVLET
jgi:hypothetical protein